MSLDQVRLLRGALALIFQASPRLAALGMGLVLAQAALAPLQLLLLKALVDALAGLPGGRSDLRQLATWAGLAAALAIVAWLVGEAQQLAQQALSLEVGDHVQELIHQKSVELDLAYFETPEFFDHLHRAQREGGQRPVRVLADLTVAARSALSLFAVTGLLMLHEPALVLLVALAALPGFAARLRTSRDLLAWHKSRTPTERLAGLYSSMLTQPSFAKEVRAYGLAGHLRGVHRELRALLRRETLAVARRRLPLRAAAGLLGGLALAAAALVVAARILAGRVLIGSAVMYYQGLQRALTAGDQLLSALARLYEHGLFLAHLEEYLRLEPHMVDPPQAAPLSLPIREGLRLEHVSFRYPGSRSDTLHDISLAIPAGSLVAVVGGNGAGKTTLVKLLTRLYDPDSGRILLDGRDLREIRLAELRAAFGVLCQDYVRFPGRVAESIGYGDTARLGDLEAIREAARFSGSDADVAGLADGYDTLLGRAFQGGKELSAGQWQKLALARARFRDAPLLVLDEPSSALDALAEAELLARLRALLRGRTALLVSHRFAAVRAADRIVVLERGRLLEQGTHDELMRAGGLYATMFEAQASPYLAAAPAGDR